jgi:oxygen-dependent protoporphyrinogen oxidase
MSDGVDAIVVGGGIAGLAVAYELHRRQVPFLLLEAAERVGGVILSEQVDGFTIDAGPDSLLVQKPAAIQFCTELGLGDRLVPTKPPRWSYVLRGSRLYPLPAGSVLGVPTRLAPFATTRLFSLVGKIRMGAELFVPPRRDETDESIGAFMTRRFGHEATTYLAEPLLAGIHAGDVDRLSVRALFPRFTEAERTHGSLLRAFRRQRATPPADGVFRSLPLGLSEIVRAVIRTLPADRVSLEARVVGVEAGEHSCRVHLASGESQSARALVLATPAFVTATLLRDTDAEIARLAAEVPYASTATVALAFPRAAVRHPLQGTGFVAPRVEDARILAASWLSSKWPARAPDDTVLVRTFAGGARDPDAVGRSDADLINESLDVLTPLLGITAPPMLARVYRWARASAQYEVGHLARVRAIERALARHPWLRITGSGFRGVGIPDNIADGRETAGRVDQWLQQQSTVS